MIVNRRLNLVQPIDTATGTVYLHSVPISREVWESYFLVLAKTYAEIMKQGLTVIAGPPVARLLLKVVAQQIGAWEGENGVERGLLPELRCSMAMDGDSPSIYSTSGLSMSSRNCRA